MGAKFSKDQFTSIETRPEVLTPYGVGLELNTKTRADGMTAVQLPWAVAYVPASSLTRPFSVVQTPGGVGVVKSVVGSVADVKLSWADAQVNTNVKDVTKVYDHSDVKLRVKTAYGEGILRGAARLDGLLTVQLPWAIAYCTPDAVSQIL